MARLRVLVLVVAALVLVGGCSAQTGASTASPTAAGEALKFGAKTVDGADFSGQSLAGRPAVL